MNLTKAIWIALLIIWTGSNHAFAETTMSLNTADSPPYSKPDNSGFYDVLLTQAFNKLGIDISINHLPSKRSIFNANAGIDDGEYARVRGIDENYDNLILVDEKLIDFGFTAFTKDKHIEITRWNDLQNYNVAYINGWKIFENNVTTHKSLVIANDQQGLFDLLVNDRVDVVLYEKWRGLDHIKAAGLAGLYPAPEPIENKGMYLYLNKQHGLLVPEVQRALQVMKKEGQYDKLIESILEN